MHFSVGMQIRFTKRKGRNSAPPAPNLKTADTTLSSPSFWPKQLAFWVSGQRYRAKSQSRHGSVFGIIPTMPLIEKIVSGGQTGADRAALDWAIANGIPHGGWCPKGRLAEDGPIPPRYNLTETPSSNYPQRTEWNVRDSDGTVAFSIAPTLSGGSKKTVELAQKHGKPVIHICRETENPAETLLRFIRSNGIGILNVAGPRGSKEPEVGAFVADTLSAALAILRHGD